MTRARDLAKGTFSGDLTVDTNTLVVDSANNCVGIGTSSPTSYNSNIDDLVVYNAASGGITIATGTTSQGAIAFADGTGAADEVMGRIRYSHDVNEMDFRVNNAEAMRIDSSGNVGIGTSSPNANHKLTIVDVSGNGGGTLGLNVSSSGSSDNLGRLHFGNATDPVLAAIFGVADGSADSGALTFRTEKTGEALEERMRIDSAGRVTMPYQPAFRISYSSATGGDTGSEQDLTFKVQEQNIGGHYNSTTGKFTAPVSGTYMFMLSLLMTGMGGGDNFEIFIRKNGSSAQNGARTVYSAGSTGFGGYISGLAVCQIPLSVNDFVTFQYYRTGSTATIYSGAVWSSYSGHLVG